MSIVRQYFCRIIIVLSMLLAGQVSIAQDTDVVDSTVIKQLNKPKKDWNTWKPSTKKAMWLSVVLPGAGQVYNRKYWKLPIIYGGIVGCVYAIRWNGMMYNDYSQAYMDIMDDDPDTQGYNQFLHLGNTVTDENSTQYANMFKRRKDYYRRYRDLSYIVLVGVYALQVVDAYVDASLSDFDISDDLSLSVAPTIMTSSSDKMSLHNTAIGLRCCLTF